MTQSIAAYSPRCKGNEQAMYHEQGVQDLTTNLLHRAKELRNGNYLYHIVTMMICPVLF